MAVYKAKPPVVTIDSVRELGRKFGFECEPAVAEDGIWIADKVDGKDRHLIVHSNSGGINYYGPCDLHPPDPPTLPGDDEAKRIATDFLSKRGLLPTGLEAMEVICGGSSGYGCAHLLVRFTPHGIDGVPVTGPGAKFGVRIGDKGEIISAMVAFRREIEPYKAAAIISPAEAYEQFKAGKSSYPVSASGGKITIQEISLAYWIEAMPEEQQYIAPVYIFEGNHLTADDSTSQFTSWVEALKGE